MHIPSVQDQVSAQEWQLRVDLAACYRLVAAYGWSDLIFTHISARLPGDDHHFLINPYGMLFDEVTASSLIKVDQQCREQFAHRSRREIQRRGGLADPALLVENSYSHNRDPPSPAVYRGCVFT